MIKHLNLAAAVTITLMLLLGPTIFAVTAAGFTLGFAIGFTVRSLFDLAVQA